MQVDGPAVYGAITVSTSALEVKVGASRLQERQFVTVQPTTGDIWFGYDSSVTTTTGTKIFKNQFFPIDAADTLPVYIIALEPINVRISEVG
jgi:hypothetical protein